MRTAQVHLKRSEWSATEFDKLKSLNPQLVLGYGNIDWLAKDGFVEKLNRDVGAPCFAGCSTAGEITNKGRFDESLVLTAIHFDEATSRVEAQVFPLEKNQHDTGIAIGSALKKPDLRLVLLFTTMGSLDGSALLLALKQTVGDSVHVTGGIAGDSGRFKQSVVFRNASTSSSGILAVAFYGPSLATQHGVGTGFQTFGNVRTVTRASNFTVFEIDGRPALDVYKEALGKHAAELPTNGLMFPLSVLDQNQQESGLIRAVMTVDEVAKTVTLAGDIESGARVRFMRAHNQSLVEGARGAAGRAALPSIPPQSLGLLISCVARKFIMGDAIDDELEAAADELKNCATTTGFYAYGEFGPFFSQNDCQLHNQTLTITVLSENSLN